MKSILDSVEDDPETANVTKFAQMSMQHSTTTDLDQNDGWVDGLGNARTVTKV